jgi:hypothetical protein
LRKMLFAHLGEQPLRILKMDCAEEKDKGEHWARHCNRDVMGVWQENQEQSKQDGRGRYNLARLLFSAPAHNMSTIRDSRDDAGTEPVAATIHKRLDTPTLVLIEGVGHQPQGYK